MSSTDDMNWELCCLCQSNKTQEVLQAPKNEGLLSLERDLTNFNVINADSVPSGINVTLNQLDDGSGIAATLKSHEAKYQKTCRRYCGSSRVKRARGKLGKDVSEQNSPKKLRSSSSVHPLTNVACVICLDNDQANLHKVVTDVVDANLKSWRRPMTIFSCLVD